VFSLVSKTELLEISLTFPEQLFTVQGSFVSPFLIFLKQHFIRVFHRKMSHRAVKWNHPFFFGNISLAKNYLSEKYKQVEPTEWKGRNVQIFFQFLCSIWNTKWI